MLNFHSAIAEELEAGPWTALEWCPWYLIHPGGHVYNTKVNRLMVLRKVQTGLLMVGLSVDGHQYQRSVAKLVAEVYLPQPDPVGLSHFDTIIHMNGDKSDCRAENLMWRPRWFAIKYNQERLDFNYDNYMTGPFECIQTGEIFNTIWDICVTQGLLGFPVFQSIFDQQPQTNTPEIQKSYVFPYGFQFRHYNPN